MPEHVVRELDIAKEIWADISATSPLQNTLILVLGIESMLMSRNRLGMLILGFRGS